MKKSNKVALTIVSALTIAGCSHEKKVTPHETSPIVHGWTNSSDTVISYQHHNHFFYPHYFMYSRFGLMSHGSYHESMRGFNRGSMGAHTYSSMGSRSSFGARIASSRGGFGHISVGHSVSS